MPTTDVVLLEVKGLIKHFPVRKRSFRHSKGMVKAVDGIDMRILRGETLGLVGESGCGKTTAGRSILRLVEPTKGEIVFHSRRMARGASADAQAVDVVKASRSEMKLLRRDMQIIFQDPYSSLNPRMTVGSIIGEPLLVHIALGALSVIGAIVLFACLGLAGTIVIAQGEQAAAGILGIIAVVLCGFLVVLGLPGIIGGWALITERSWGRPLVLVLGVLNLFNLPIGTAVGIYTLWALLSEASDSPPRIPGLAPVALSSTAR